MKYRWDKKYLYWGVTLLAVIVLSILCYYFLFRSDNVSKVFGRSISITMPVINGLVIAYLLTPVLNFIEAKILFPFWKKTKLTHTEKTKKHIRSIGIFFTLIFFFLVIYTLFSMIVPQIIVSIQSIILKLPSYLENFYIWIGQMLRDYPDIEPLVMKYSTTIEGWLSGEALPQINFLLRSVSTSVFSVLIALWDILIGLVISVYILSSKELFIAQSKKTIYAIFSKDKANMFISNLRFTHKTFGGFISGKILDSLIIGLLCFVGTYLLKMPYVVLISVIIGVTNIIPFFGPYFGAIPCAFLILLVDPLKCLYFILFILVLQQFDGNILGPKILGDSTGLSSFWVIFAITVFGGFWGVIGMIIGVPVFAVIYAGIKSLVGQHLIKKNLPTETAAYMDTEPISQVRTAAVDASDTTAENKDEI